MQRKSYTTKQREKILEFFKSNADKCFCAKDIVQDKSISVGQATVYRTLNSLVKEGVLRRFTEDTTDRALYQYSGNHCSEHFHLTCLNCGVTIHMDREFMGDIERHIQKDHDFYLDNSRSVLFGLCGSCSGGGNTDTEHTCTSHRKCTCGGHHA